MSELPEHIEALPPLKPVPRLLEGQAALVTGGSSGIGKAVALALGAAGADVAVNYVGRAASAEAVAGQIRSGGTRAIAVQGDVSKEEDVVRVVGEAVAAFGTIDILIANAGLQRDALVADMSLADWQKVIDVNLTGQFLCAQAAVKEFRRRGRRPQVSRALGKIICMSSVHDVIPWAGHANYAASKGGVMLMMKSLAQELAPERIRVNSICPGAIRTPINTEAWETPEAYAALKTLIPAKRIGEPDDIARVAVWLASDEADYIYGINLYVDGGMTLYPGFEGGG
ncbi:MAG: SDR family oxidoreductase [Rhodospirillaceae bacterium]|nr:SDR family oxidoreductase [Rhodospirillaceae bacterium]MCA8933395.1 SDR family oxidoreductase [Rhodospirillaceae bacterium]